MRRNGEVAVYMYRLKSSQVDKQAAATARQKRAFIDALKESSAEYAKEQQSGGSNGTTPSSAAAVATVLADVRPRCDRARAWMLLASSGSGSGGRAQLALEGPAAAPLALMSPATDMDTVG